MTEVAVALRSPEVYARSLRSLRLLGEAALADCEIDYDDGFVAEPWHDFTTALGENLATDKEYGERLNFDPMRSYEKREGKVVTRDGKPVVDLVSDGLACSRVAAQTDPEMEIQVIRDEGDVMVAKTVDNLAVGELLAVVSMDPKEALKRNPRYWRRKAYREGLAVLQVYFCASEDEVIAGAYSIKKSNMRILRDIFGSYGTTVPEGESADTWIRHGIRLQVDRTKAEQFGPSIVACHRKELGIDGPSLSVTDLIAANEKLVKNCFETYVRPLAVSLKTGVPGGKLRELAFEMMQAHTDYEPPEMHSLMRFSNGSEITEDDVRFMEERIRYALVEELRKLLPSKEALTKQAEFAPNDLGWIVAVEQAVFERDMSHIMANNIAAGMSAGRSYGGCSPAGTEGQRGELTETSEIGADSQSVFGGKSGEQESELSDDFGPLKFKCPNGHWNKRPPEKRGERTPKHFLHQCKTCKVSLKC